MRPTFLSGLIALLPAGAAAQLSRLVLRVDLEREDGVVAISSTHASLGRDVGPAGDVDGDGLDDILIRAVGDSRVFLDLGQPALPGQIHPLSAGEQISIIEIDRGPSDSPGVELGGNRGLACLLLGDSHLPAAIDANSSVDKSGRPRVDVPKGSPPLNVLCTAAASDPDGEGIARSFGTGAEVQSGRIGPAGEWNDDGPADFAQTGSRLLFKETPGSVRVVLGPCAGRIQPLSFLSLFLLSMAPRVTVATGVRERPAPCREEWQDATRDDLECRRGRCESYAARF